MTRKELAKALYDKAYIRGEFLLRSGVKSTEYFDKYRFEAQPQLLREVAKLMAPMIPKDTEVLAGLEVGGIPIATALGLETGLPLCFVRKEAKKYGTCKFAEGEPIKDRKICIIEDVVTSGGQIILSANDLRGEGASLLKAISVVDREQGGPEKLAKENILFEALFTFSELKA